MNLFSDAHKGVASEELDKDKLMDVFDNSVPSSWNKQMVLQGFEPVKSTIQDFIEFCERIKQAEVMEPTKPGVQVAEGKSTSKKSSGGGRSAKRVKTKHDKNSKQDDKECHCVLHGANALHDTEDCWELKKQAVALKNDKKDSQKQKAKGKGEKSYSAKDLDVLAKAQTKKIVAKAIKKHKKQEEEVAIAPSDEEADAYNFKKLKIDDCDISLGSLADDISSVES